MGTIQWGPTGLRAILFTPTNRPQVASVPLPPFERAGYVLGTGTGLALLGVTRSLVPGSIVLWTQPVGGLAVLLALAGWIQASRR